MHQMARGEHLFTSEQVNAKSPTLSGEAVGRAGD